MSTWGRKCDASPGGLVRFTLPPCFDVAADDVGDIGVLFFLFLGSGHDADIAELPLMTQTTSAARFETDALSAWSCR
jgi:hypothetical protein